MSHSLKTPQSPPSYGYSYLESAVALRFKENFIASFVYNNLFPPADPRNLSAEPTEYRVDPTGKPPVFSRAKSTWDCFTVIIP